MASVAHLVTIVSQVLRMRREDVNTYARALIDGGILPKSRGRAIAQVTPRDAVALMVAAAVAPKIKDTAETARALLELKAADGTVAGDLLEALFLGAGTFPDAGRFVHVDLVHDWPEVIVRANGRTLWHFHRNRTGNWEGHLKRASSLGASAFELVRNLIADRPEGVELEVR